MPFIPHTDADVKAMLKSIGVNSIDQLFDEIPEKLRAGKLTQVPEGLSEMEVARLMQARANQDGAYANFIGAGVYEHHIPAAVWEIVTRGEFYSAYTPYQAEASQGTLQLLYEYQTMMASLTGMDISNASLYDGASALAEAVLMAVRAHKKSRKILMPSTVHPIYRRVVRAIVTNQNIELVEIPLCMECGNIIPESLKMYEGGEFAALVILQPNFSR
jgi:glycine dehydrogenase subunit 1